ncbi:MAG: hypothetical protein D6756_02035, partial [Cyanobacteria bacterium J083]
IVEENIQINSDKSNNFNLEKDNNFANSILSKTQGWIGDKPTSQDNSHPLTCNCENCCHQDHSGGTVIDHGDHFHYIDSDGAELAVLNSLNETISFNEGGNPQTVQTASLAVPQLSSNPNATAKIFLDFDGSTISGTRWNSRFNDNLDIVTPAYSNDSNTTEFSSTEIKNITEIWQRVAEDFAPFNVDVTTIDPNNFNANQGLRVVIGGSNSWYSSGAGGVAYVGSWRWSGDTPVFVFENNLNNGNPKLIAEATSHEIGHALGLYHQARYDANGNQTQSYHTGDNGWAPLMGVGYYQDLTTWSNGKNSYSMVQDDMSIIASASNGFGYRVDDYGNNQADAYVISSNNFNIEGLIQHHTDDIDVFKLTTAGGQASFQVDVADIGANLDAILELWHENQQLAISNPQRDSSNKLILNAQLDTFLNAGTYYLHVKSNGEYGRVGTYTLSGNIDEPEVITPQIVIGDITVTEDSQYATFKVSLDQASNQTVSVDYNTVNGTALAGSDYIATQGTLTFNPGETQQQIQIQIIDDTVEESDENFLLEFSNIQNANFSGLVTSNDAGGLSSNLGIVKITNDDQQPKKPQSIIGEIGRINTLDHTLQTIELENTYANPVVFTTVSFEGGQPAIVRIADITSDSFSVQLQEPSNLDGWHLREELTYFVAEAGTWTLEDGTLIEIGQLSTAAHSRGQWANIDYEIGFNNTPVVLTQVQTWNNDEFITTRQRQGNADGVKIALQKQEDAVNTVYQDELIGYFAISSGTGTWNGYTYEAFNTGTIVDHQATKIGFNTKFADNPQILGSIASYNGGDPVVMRYDNISNTGVNILAQEDTTADKETWHVKEDI